MACRMAGKVIKGKNEGERFGCRLGSGRECAKPHFRLAFRSVPSLSTRDEMVLEGEVGEGAD